MFRVQGLGFGNWGPHSKDCSILGFMWRVAPKDKDMKNAMETEVYRGL